MKVNKMSKKAQQSQMNQQSTFLTFNNFLNSYGCLSSLSLTHNKQKILKSISKGKKLSNLIEKNKKIRQQNGRLITRIMQIKQRKVKQSKSIIIRSPKKIHNPEKQRQISQQNHRLGRSLIMIKSGKTLQRIKTQIVKKNLKLNQVNSTIRIRTSQSQSQNLFMECNIPTFVRNNAINLILNKSIDVDSIIQSRRKKPLEM